DYFREPGSAARLSSDLFGGQDFSIVNLEGPVTARRHPSAKTGPSLRMSDDALAHLAASRINCVTLANNHILDYGLEGLADTLGHCGDAELLTVGAATAHSDMG